MAGLRRPRKFDLDRFGGDGFAFRSDVFTAEYPRDQQPVDEESDECDGAEVQQEIAISQPGERADEHVLRVAGDGGHAANVRSGGDGEQIGQRLQLHLPRSDQRERNHHQADDVVDEECRQHAGDEDDGGQQVARFEALDDLGGDPVEEAGEMQAADDHHHGEQQDERAEVDEAQRLIWRPRCRMPP